MRLLAKRQPTLLSKKYYSMLLGGTLTMMVVSVMLMSDSFIAGAILGPDGVAGVTLIAPVYSLSAFFGTIISLGVPILYATEMGKFNKKGADQTFGFGVLMALIMGVVLFALVCLLGDVYLQSCSPTPEVLAQARGYLFWMRFTILIMPMQMLMGAAVYGDGDETVSTIANVVQGVGNITFSILLCRLAGIRGIGFSSFLFNAVSIGVFLTHFLKKSNSLRWNLYFSFDLVKKTVSYSIIDSSSYLFMSILTATLNTFISLQFGPEYLILASAITLCREFQLLFDGVGEAVGPIFGVYVGEQNHSALRSSYALANKTAVVEGILVTLVLVVIAPFVPGFLNVTDPEIARCIIAGVRWTALGSTFVSLLYLLTSYYLVIEQIAIGLAACALRDVVFSVGLAVLFGKLFGISGMFIGLGVAPAVAYGLFMMFLLLRYGKADCPLLLSKVPGDERSYLFYLAAEPEQIIGLQKKVEALLLENGVDTRTVGKVKLLVEELYMLICEKNGNKPVLSEFTIFLHPEEIKIITKDDGVLFDISEADVSVTSLAAFAVSAYMEKLGQNRRHLTTMSFNRSTFVIKPHSDGKETNL
ncbi:MAG: multidrug transporter MatE [Clostridia bacterium]|nr:multidrug transporter MatE [Clostridia bacterium]